MQKILLHNTTTAHWQALVREAQETCEAVLQEDVESYLVFLLMRFTDKPEMAASVLAMEFLRGVDAVGSRRHDILRNVGDKCLLFSGLFPGRAEKRRVSLGYFIDLGQSAYAILSESPASAVSDLYSGLCDNYITMMDVLHTIRVMTGAEQDLQLLQAAELWRDTGSLHALHVMRQVCDGVPVRRFINDEQQMPQ